MISKFKQLHAGQRVFLIGNGPSLKRTPLDRIVNEQSFAMNRIALIYKETTWRPTYFICTTTNIEDPEWRSNIMQTVELGIPCFVWDELLTYFPKSENIYPIACSHGSEVVRKAPDEWWSDDISERVCKFGTSMLPALQISAYMGFDPIYLLGCDLGFKGDSLMTKVLRRLGFSGRAKSRADPNHFHGGYGTPGLHANALNYNMLAAHELTARHLNKDKPKVFNASLGGTLEVYPRTDFMAITEAGGA